MHTKGPWVTWIDIPTKCLSALPKTVAIIRRDSDAPGNLAHDDRWVALAVFDAHKNSYNGDEAYTSNQEQAANARLIAAAPELLAALKEFVDDEPSQCPPNHCRHQRAKAAIAKAEGRQ